VRSALKRLYLRFHEHHDVLTYAIASLDAGGPDGLALDPDAFLVVGAAAPRLVYRAMSQTDPDAARRTLALAVLVRAEPAAAPVGSAAVPPVAWRRVEMWFDPQALVAKAVRQLDIVAGALDSFGHCGFFVVPPVGEDGEENGYWMLENR
jgi:hypothetical protein